MPTTSRMMIRSNRIRLIAPATLLLILLLPLSANAAEDIPVQVEKILEFYKQGDLAQGAAALEQLEKADPGSPHLPRLWLAAAQAQTNPMEASRFFRMVTDRYPESAQAPIAQADHAQLMFVSGNSRAATAEAKRFLEKYPTHAGSFEISMLLANLYYREGMIAQAANTYAAAAAKHPNHPSVGQAYVGIGDCRLRMKDVKSAQRAYFKALEQGSPTLDHGKVYYQLGVIAKGQNMSGQARRYFLLTIRDYPGSRFSSQANRALKEMGYVKNQPIGLLGDQALKPIKIPRATYGVRVAALPSAQKAEKFAQRFRNAGHTVVIRIVDGKHEVVVGRFQGEMDTYYFAEQLKKKFGVRTKIVRLDK